jgi:hypothetical protein
MKRNVVTRETAKKLKAAGFPGGVDVALLRGHGPSR